MRNRQFVANMRDAPSPRHQRMTPVNRRSECIAVCEQAGSNGEHKLAVKCSATCPMCDLKSLTVDCGATADLNLAIRTQRYAPPHPGVVPTIAERNNHRLLDESAPQVRPSNLSAMRDEHGYASPVPEVGRVLRNRYVLESLLGSGGWELYSKQLIDTAMIFRRAIGTWQLNFLMVEPAIAQESYRIYDANFIVRRRLRTAVSSRSMNWIGMMISSSSPWSSSRANR